MTDNQDTTIMGCVTNLPIFDVTSAQSKFQQLINQVQDLTQVVLATQ